MEKQQRRTALTETRTAQTMLMLVPAVGLPVLIGATTAARRGWPVGLICGLIFAVLFGAGLWPSLRTWSRHHPLLDGAFLGPLTFVLACFVRPVPIWACAFIGVVATAGGILLGRRRRGRRPLPDE